MHKLYDFMEARERLSTITVKQNCFTVMCSPMKVAMMYISSQKTYK